MSRITNDDQFQFLISCIRHSNNGKVLILSTSPAVTIQCGIVTVPTQIDYTEVAKECSIVSRGAAYVLLPPLHHLHFPLNGCLYRIKLINTVSSDTPDS